MEERPLSAVPPFLIAALVCEIAVREPTTGKQNLIGIFDRLHVRRFPIQHAMSLYFKLADAEGYYRLRVDFVYASGDKVLAQAGGELASQDRTLSMDLSINFPALPIAEPGRYEFRIYANDMYLGSAAIEAIQRPPSVPPE